MEDSWTFKKTQPIKAFDYNYITENFKVEPGIEVDFPASFDVITWSDAERYCCHYPCIIDNIVSNITDTIDIINEFNKDKSSLTDFFNIIMKANPNLHIIGNFNNTYSTKFQNAMMNFKSIITEKIPFDYGFWNILTKHDAWVTGRVMSSITGNSCKDIDIVTSNKSNFHIAMLIKLDLKKEPTCKIFKIKQKNAYHSILELEYQNKNYTINIFSSLNTPLNAVEAFHFGCVKAMYNGTAFKCLPSYIISMYTGINYYTKDNAFHNECELADEYVLRGFLHLTNYPEESAFSDNTHSYIKMKKFEGYPL